MESRRRLARPPERKPIRDELARLKALDGEMEKKLNEAIAKFKAGWKPKA